MKSSFVRCVPVFLALGSVSCRGVLDYRSALATASVPQPATVARNALALRRPTPEFRILERQVRAIPSSARVLVVEIVSSGDETYSFILITESGPNLEITTNILPVADAGGDIDVQILPDVRVYAIPGAPALASLFQASIPQAAFAGAGGNPRLLDADTVFFTDRSSEIIFRGGAFEPFVSGAPPPAVDPDRARYAAIQNALRLWLEALRSPPAPSRTFAVP